MKNPAFSLGEEGAGPSISGGGVECFQGKF